MMFIPSSVMGAVVVIDELIEDIISFNVGFRVIDVALNAIVVLTPSATSTELANDLSSAGVVGHVEVGQIHSFMVDIEGSVHVVFDLGIVVVGSCFVIVVDLILVVVAVVTFDILVVTVVAIVVVEITVDDLVVTVDVVGLAVVVVVVVGASISKLASFM